MTSLYWICFVLGGVFVAFAILGGIEGFDFDHGVDLDPAIDADIEFSAPSRQRIPLLGLLKSFKFWTFGLCFFGLTGLVLTPMGVAAPLVLVLAIAMGLLLGGAIASILRLLYHRRVDSLVQTGDLVGRVGTVELPFDRHSKGKVKLQLKGVNIEFIAHTDDSQGFAIGAPVLVVEVNNNRLWVISADAVNQEEP
ncbi:MAG: NfeD-like protein [Thermosynechococcaceae cyanobacterium]